MLGDALRIRVAEPEDVAEIVDLNYALFQEDAGSRDPSVNLDWARQEGRDYFTGLLSGDAASLWLAESPDEDVALGYLAGRFNEGNALRPIKITVLESMYVRRAYRGCGLGEKLFEQFLVWSRERGAQRLSVTAYAANKGAVRFYERLGFCPKSLSLEREVGH